MNKTNGKEYNLEQKLFQINIDSLFDKYYTTKEIMSFTGWCRSTIKNYKREWLKQAKDKG